MSTSELRIWSILGGEAEEMIRFMWSLEKVHEELLDHNHGMVVVLDALAKSIFMGGPVIEIGTRLGGSAICFMEIIKKYKKNNWVITVDPYGSLPFETEAAPGVSVNSAYDEGMYRRAVYEMSKFAYENSLNHMHFKATSEQFMNQYDKFEMFDEGKKTKLEDPCFVYLDGHHFWKIREAHFFLKRLRPKGCLIIDDSQYIQEELEKEFGETHQVFHIPGNRSAIIHKETDTFLYNIGKYREDNSP
jgi:hypothetical protein